MTSALPETKGGVVYAPLSPCPEAPPPVASSRKKPPLERKSVERWMNVFLPAAKRLFSPALLWFGRRRSQHAHQGVVSVSLCLTRGLVVGFFFCPPEEMSQNSADGPAELRLKWSKLRVYGFVSGRMRTSLVRQDGTGSGSHFGRCVFGRVFETAASVNFNGGRGSGWAVRARFRAALKSAVVALESGSEGRNARNAGTFRFNSTGFYLFFEISTEV